MNGETNTTGGIGLILGLWSNYELSKLFGLQIEALYVQQGGSRKANIFGFDITTEIDINYFTIPIGLSYRPIKLFDLHGGIQPGVVVKKQVVTRDMFGNTDVGDVTGVKTFDAVWYLGTTIKLPIKNGDWSVTLRYRSGLISIAQDDDTLDVKNRGFSVSAQYIIPIKKSLLEKYL